MNTNLKKNKLLSLVLALILVIGTNSMPSFADSVSASSVNITVAAQAYGGFLAPLDLVSVSSDISDTYGYTDSVTDGISVLDALIKIHEVIFGEDFTAEAASEFLAVSGGYVTKVFGESTSAFGFLINGGYPNDGTESSYGGYNGTTITTQKISENDKIDFFVYQDLSDYLDKYTWIDGDLKIKPGTDVEISVKSSYVMNGYLYKTSADFKSSAETCESVSLGWVNISSGAVTEISGLYTDEDGKAVINIPEDIECGTYYITAMGTDVSDVPVIMNPAMLTVTNDAVDESVHVTDIEMQSALTLTEGDIKPIQYSVKPDNATDKSVAWSSDNEAAATVSDGKVTAVKEGSAIITATSADGGITASCTVTVERKKQPLPIETMNAIAKKYSESGIAADANAPWLAADMENYCEVFADTEFCLSDEQKQQYVDLIADSVNNASAPSDLSKYIIALSSLGFDPTNVVKSDFSSLNIVEKLSNLIDEQNAKVTNVYTLPYVIIAMTQEKDYLSGEQKDFLINSAKSQKNSWQNTKWGTDAIATMITALSPYYESDSEVKTMLDESVNLIKNVQSETGSCGNAASTGLVITALSSLGIDASEFKNNNNSLIDGLMLYISDSNDGFKPTNNTFATEQGFRGLVSWQILKNNIKKNAFDFSSLPKKTAQASWAKNCPVTFEVIPSDAIVEIEGQSAVYENKFDLTAGEYNYTVSKDGYTEKKSVVTVSEEEQNNHTPKNIKVSLSDKPTSGSSKISTKIKIMMHSKNACNGKFTYKNNAREYTALASGSVSLSSGQTVFDALNTFAVENKISFEEKTFGYISKIGSDEEFDHGSNSGWMFSVNGTVSNKGCRDVILTGNSTVIWFYTDDCTNEYGSEKWHSSGGGSSSSTVNVKFDTNGADEVKDITVAKNNTITKPADPVRDGYVFAGWYTDKKLTKEFDFSEKVTANITLYAKWEKKDAELVDDKDFVNPFTDVTEDAWYYTYALYAAKNNIMNGVSENEFSPDTNLTRAMFVTILYRIDGSSQLGTASFDDVDEGSWYSGSVAWAAENKLVNGISENEFAPGMNITREQAAAILARYAKYKGEDTESTNDFDISSFTDSGDISSYAVNAICYAVSKGYINGKSKTHICPAENMTRAETAALIMRFCEE
ncbi:MAG: S-layer homology domain-containing protein [Clostridia bacterium]|nr:S-layer homology domain-containing protein [Clostridia bacterium]